MRYNEPTAALRRIPVYLVDDAGEPVESAAPSGSEIRVSKSGGGWGNAAGTWSEAGDGVYTYEATQAETATGSFLLLRVAIAGARPYVYAVDIGDRLAPAAAADERRVPIYLVDADGDPVPGLTLSGAEVRLSLAGAALADGLGTADEIGDGAYYYELAADELVEGPGLLRIEDGAAQVYVYAWDVRPAGAALAEAPDPIPDEVVSELGIETIDYVARALDRLPYQYRGAIDG